jgi:hypothetical protein
MNDINYLANRRKSIEKIQQNSIMEKHHILGKVNSNDIISLPKDWHDFITHSQNSISPEYRKHPEVLAISSMIGWFELGVEQMRIFREMKLKDLEGVQNG